MSRECSFILSNTDLGIESLTLVNDFSSVFVEVNATWMPSFLSVLLIVFEVFDTQGMVIIDVQLSSNGAWFLIRVFTLWMNLFRHE